MFRAIECKSLKIVRTVPKIWIIYVDGISHCWLPKTYTYNLRKYTEPPTITEMKARNEFFQCNILFDKEFVRVNDCDIALSKLDLSSECYFNYSMTEETETNNRNEDDNRTSEAEIAAEETVVTTEPKTRNTEKAQGETKNRNENYNLTREAEIAAEILTTEPKTRNTEKTQGETINRNRDDNLTSESMTEQKRYELNTILCEKHSFQPPIHFVKFKKLNFRYVNTFDTNDLQAGSRFLTSDEVSMIPRKINKPFCHPGPLKKCELYDWYLADSIIQEVNLKSDPFTNFVVRWVGYEDEYNTVEPLAFVKNTAVYKLFTNQNIFTACRSNNSCIRRRSMSRKRTASSCLSVSQTASTKYQCAISKLISEIQIEERVQRYSAEIGFFSYDAEADALKSQHSFFIEKFIPLMKELNSMFYVDNHYIGKMCGNLQSAADYKEVAKWSVTEPNSIKTYIDNGLRKSSQTPNNHPHYVAFLVPRKYGTNEKKNKMHKNYHMCVYVIRSYQGLKDAIYFDPSPKCYKHGVPNVLGELKKPKMQSFTYKFGVATEKDDCVYQCMRYLIGLATNEVLFEPDFSQPCSKLEQFMTIKASIEKAKKS